MIRKWSWWLTIVGTLIVCSPLLFKLAGVPFYQHAEYSDMLVSHLPNSTFIHESLREWGQIPLWNPTIYSGMPFAADPLSGMFYLPNWLTIAFPVPLAFNILVLLHLCWAAVGCYLLARRAHLPAEAAVISGIAFAGTPKALAHISLGHVSLIYAVSWTPWLLITVHHVLSGINGNKSRGAILFGSMLGLIFLADPRWAVPAGLLAVGYALHCWRNLITEQRFRAVDWVRRFLLVGIFTFGIASLLAFPLWEFVQLSTRSHLDLAAQNLFALDWGHFLGLVTPILTQAEQVTYLGVSVLILALLGVISRKPGTGFWSVVLVLSWILSLGTATPLYQLLGFFLPGAGLLRVPARMLFVGALSSAFLAAYGMAWVLDGARQLASVRILRLTSAGLLGMVVLINLILAGAGIGISVDQIMSLVSILVALLLLELWLRGKLARVWISPLLLIVIVIELFWVGRSMMRIEPYRSLMQGEGILIEEVATASYGTKRVFSPSYAIPQLAAVHGKVELADGVNPLQLSSYVDYLRNATGFELGGYGVTLPPFPDGGPKEPWPVDLNLQMVHRLNITDIVSDYPVQSDGLSLSKVAGGLYFYQLDGAYPRAWVEHGGDWLAADVLRWSPNIIQLSATGPGVLFLSEIAYPGWRVSVDGEQTQIRSADGLLRAVDLPAGDHLVTFHFKPRSLYVGLGILAVTIALGVFLWRKR